LRRFQKRIYIPLPEKHDRADFVSMFLKDILKLTEDNLDYISERTESYSGSDLRNLVNEASMMPISKI
jgi:SpoVK/Ycf46/Vps4 family AAA+-type ATPase